ncbi:MAG: C/D box methylation guide ribonucleoprotein complex aNOP56 subunit [Candidatus Asgardarchaeia archaeon]
MKLYVINSIMGPLLFDKDGNLIRMEKYPKDASKVAEIISKLEEGKLDDHHIRLLKYVSEKFKDSEVVLEGRKSYKIPENVVRGFKISVDFPSDLGKSLRRSINEILIEKGIFKDKKEYDDFVYEVSLEMSKTKVKLFSERRDKLILQVIDAIDDLTRTINLFSSRVREWYSLHFPELDPLIEDHELFFKFVSKVGSRRNLDEEKLKEIGLKDELLKKVLDASKKSLGAELSDEDIERIRDYAELAISAIERKNSLEEYVSSMMREVAPNISALIGPVIGARLIRLAGGLEELSRLPSSTVQLLGAEKALFRALRKKGKPPKHGVIFQHVFIHSAPKWLRGKIARAIAGKITIAARVDAFSGKFIADKLKEDLMRKLDEIRKKYPKPKPKKKMIKVRKRKGGRKKRKKKSKE